MSLLGIFSLLLFSFTTINGNPNNIIDQNVVEVLRFRESEKDGMHKYYISVSNATYSEESKSLQMITRFFIDDLEDVLNARIQNPIELGDVATIEDIYPYLKGYLAKKLEVEINGVNSVPSFLGAEYEGDQIVLYIELPSEKIPSTVSMKFTAFLELFEEQKNLVHLKIDGKRRTLLMDKNKGSDTVKF